MPYLGVVAFNLMDSSLQKQLPAASSDLHRWSWLLACMVCLMMMGCQSSAVLRDDDALPVGSRVEFWVYHDDLEWVESNIHIAYLPRPMTGLEARLWADGVGKRDADMRWTHYRVVAHMPEKPRFAYRSQVYPRGHLMKREFIPGTVPPATHPNF